MILEKGVFVLIEACKILKERSIEFECHFIGAWAEISEKEFKNRIISHNLTNHVFTHGKKYGDEKADFLNNTDIFVFPTFYRNECFPLVLLEAMQFSLPIISTFEGGIPDIVIEGETGLLVPQQDPLELAEKIEILIKNPELRLTMGMSGKKRFDDLFVLEKFEKRLTNILKEAIEQ